MKTIINCIDWLTELTGKIAAWLIFFMLLLTFLVVFLRYGLDLGSIAMQELIIYCHAFIFLIGAAYTLKHDEHVRVDIFYQNFTPRQKAWVNAIGTLTLLLPFVVFLLFTSWESFHQAWLIREGSPDPGGLPIRYLFKGLVPLAMILLILQAMAEFFRAAYTLVCETGS